MTLHAGRPATGLGHYLRDMVYGANDGVITTLAVIAGATGASLPARVAIILGLANLVADGFSMGASNYLGLKSELEQKGESVRAEHPVRHGLVTLAAFVVAGAVPLLTYAAPRPFGAPDLAVAGALSALTLALVGGARARFVPRRRVVLAAEMVLVGGLAAAAAFGVGAAARGLLG